MPITVVLASDIVEVLATINGEAVVFTQADYAPEYWLAVVDPASDHWYHIRLTARDEAGNVTDYNDDIYYRLPVFIFDRTQEDVDYVNELSAKMKNGTLTDDEADAWYGKHLKGVRNYDDFDRILFNMDAIEKKCGASSGRPTYIPEIPWESWVKRVRDAVETLRSTQMVHPDTPQTPQLPINTYQKMNDLEKILFDVYMIYLNMVNHYSYEIYCDDEIGVVE